MHLKYKFEMMELGDQFVAVPVGEGAEHLHGVIKLNETAALIFKLLEEETTEKAIIQKLLTEYDIPEEVVTKDLSNYIQTFQEKDILVI